MSSTKPIVATGIHLMDTSTRPLAQLTDDRAKLGDLINRLSLQPHPEGGYYREVFRSAENVEPADERGQRSAITTIYYALAAGSFSRWHRVKSDEIWHHYAGGPLELLTISPDFNSAEQQLLGSVFEGAEPVRVVRANWWQAARPVEGFALAGCSVGPGFDFSDFGFLASNEELTTQFTELYPQWRHFL